MGGNIERHPKTFLLYWNSSNNFILNLNIFKAASADDGKFSFGSQKV